jgi:hypothetical protein
VPRLIEGANGRISFHWEAICPRRSVYRARGRTSFVGNVEAWIGQVSNPRRKAKAQQVAEGKCMVRESCGVGVVFFNLEVRLVVEQSISPCVASRTVALIALV